jgi:elongation factor P
MPSPTSVKKGNVIKDKNDLWSVLNCSRSNSSQSVGFVHIRMKSLSTGKVIENTYRSTESVELAEVMNKKMQYIFKEGGFYTFMDMVSFEQVVIDDQVVGDSAQYLKEGLEVTVIMYGDKPISIDLPIKIDYVVAQTEPASKGDTVSGNVQKDAVMDNGLNVRVPIFINQGDTIRVNTEEGVYIERVNK